jgi:hypothetical protein
LMLAVALVVLSGCGGSGGRVTTSTQPVHLTAVRAHRADPVVRSGESPLCGPGAIENYLGCGADETTELRAPR